MAIQRQGNWLGSMRVDVPHLRLLESAVAGDFQALSGTLMAGTRALVAWGATILDVGTVGTSASSLLLRMASAVLLHATASEPGAVFTVDSVQPDDTLNGTNARVVGSFTPGVSQVNYVSLDLVRLADPTTQDAVVFRSASTDAEFTQVVPLGRVLQYRIHITTSDFGTTPSFCPIAKVIVDANGNVEQVIDARQMFWRLGSGGTTPNALAQYVWSNRNEATSTSAFTGGDKDIRSQADFNRATMQRLWELGGGEHWYAPADDRSVQLTYDNSAVFPATGENWDAISSPGNLLWRGLSYWFANSTATENLVADATIATPGLTDLADGELIYVELNRTSNVTVNPVKVAWSTLFALPPATPGSRHVLAWRQHGRVFVGNQSVVVNTAGVHATNTSFGTVKLYTAFAPAAANPVVPVMDADSAVVLANPATQANVVARGITRDVAGILRLGAGANDTSTYIGRPGADTTVFADHLVIGNSISEVLAALANPYLVLGVPATSGQMVFNSGRDYIGAPGVTLTIGSLFEFQERANPGAVDYPLLTVSPAVAGAGGGVVRAVDLGAGASAFLSRFESLTFSNPYAAMPLTLSTVTNATQSAIVVKSMVARTLSTTAVVDVFDVATLLVQMGYIGTGGEHVGLVAYGTGDVGSNAIRALGGAGGTALVATATGPNTGISGTGGTSAGNGVVGTGGGGLGGGGHGVIGVGASAASGRPGDGIHGTGGTGSGIGVRGIGGATNGPGVVGEGAGTGPGVRGVGTSGHGGEFTGNATSAALNVTSVTVADPTTLVEGDIWIRSDLSQLCYFSNGSIHRLGP